MTDSGIRALSSLLIDVNKDWQGHTLTNIKKAIAAGHPLTYEQMIAVVGFAWIGETGENDCYALAQDTDYIYAGLGIDPARVIKIDNRRRFPHFYQ